MGNEAYQQRKDIDLTPGEDGLIHVPKNIVVYLTKDQAEATWKSLCDYAEKNGKVKTHEQIENCIFLVDGEKEITPNSVYGSYIQSDVGTLASLNMVPKVNDANRLAQTDKNYQKDDPDYIPPTQDFTKKIKNWYEKRLITANQHNAIIRGILLSSGSIHNDWVYALTGEDAGREQEAAVLDIHDRRIDDPNVPLTVKGGVNVGDPDNATDRKKLSVFGETELQDGTTFGRLLDTFGEQFPMYFGHLIPDQGQYHKVYINRGEDRYNAEDWDDTDNIIEYWKYDTTGEKNEWKQITKSEIPSDASIVSVNILPETPAVNTYYSIDVQVPYYGTGFGTIEAYKEIVSHTTVNADRGIIIEDGLGDRTDKKIQKRIENKENYFEPTGAQTHQTNGFALSVHHDGAKIKGHTYIQDEGSANLFFKEGNTIYKVNASSQDGFDIVNINDIKKNCWFCVDYVLHYYKYENEAWTKIKKSEIPQGITIEQVDILPENPEYTYYALKVSDDNDWQYRHFCTNKDNNIEPVVDRWYGHLYYEGRCSIKGQEGWKYCYNGVEYYYDGTFHVIENHKDIQPGEIFTLGNDKTTYYRMEENPLSKVLERYQYEFKGIYTDVESDENLDVDPPVYYVKDMVITVGQDTFDYTANLRVRPKTDKVYQIKETYIETDNLYGLIDQGTYSANTYLYWDGIKFIPVPNRYDGNNNEVYNQKQDYGSLTIGTRVQNNEQNNDTIGRNSLEVGKLNEAIGDNSVAQGDSNYVSAINGHAEGLHTKVTGEFSHAEGAGIVGKIWKQEAGQHGSYINYGEEDRITEVKGVASHAEGGTQYIEGVQSHAEGRAHKILGYFTDSVHAEGSENEIQDSANYSHAEGELNIIARDSYDAHVEGLGNVVDRNYQHLAGVLANTKHQVNTYYSDDTETKKEKPVIYAIGDGASEKRRPDRINTTDKLRAYWKYENNEWVEYAKLPYSENPIPTEKVSALPTVNIDPDTYYYLYEKGNLFAVTEDGDTYVAGHLEVDGTSDLSGRATIGDSDSVADHSDANPALDVLKHSRFREKVTIERDGQATADLDMIWPTDDISLAVKGESLFGDTLTIGEAGDRDEETGTFWANLDNDRQCSEFIGLNVHGEIKNERIPDNLYTSMVVQGERKFNQFADKFWTNSSIATATATYRGCYTEADYGPNIDPEDREAMSAWLDENVNPFVPGKVLEFALFGDLPNPKNYWQYIVAGSRWNKVENVPAGATIEVVYALPTSGEANKYYELNATMNVIYHVLGVNKYYQWVWDDDTHATGDYTEVNATPDNNDYCFVQIEEDAPILPYVLFPDDETIADPLELEDSEVDGKNIITHRYKYVQILDPVTGEVLNQGWRFEYQLNNSGFTQAQWDAINSGVTSSWKTDIENRFTLLKNYVDSALEHFGDNFVTLNTDQVITGKKKFDQGIAFSNPGYNSWIWLTNSTNKNPYVVHYTLPSNTQFTQYGTTHYTEEELAALSYVKDNFVYTYYKENSQNIPEIQNIKSPKRFLSSDKDHRGIAFGWNKNNQDVYVWLGIKYEASQNVNEFILPTSVQFPAGQTYNTQELAALSYVRDNFIDKTNDYGYIDGQKRFINGIAFGTDNPAGTTSTWTWLKRATNYNYYVPFFTLPSTIQFKNQWSGAYNTTQELAALSYVEDNFIDTTTNYSNINGSKRFTYERGIAFKGASDGYIYVGTNQTKTYYATQFYLPGSEQFPYIQGQSYDAQELAAKEYVDNKFAEVFSIEFQTDTLNKHEKPHETVKTCLLRSYKTDSGSYIGYCQFNMYQTLHYNRGTNRIQYHITPATKAKFKSFKIIDSQFLIDDDSYADDCGIDATEAEWSPNFDDFYIKSLSSVTFNNVLTVYLKVEFTV